MLHAGTISDTHSRDAMLRLARERFERAGPDMRYHASNLAPYVWLLLKTDPSAREGIEQYYRLTYEDERPEWNAFANRVDNPCAELIFEFRTLILEE